ncbi:hypothetical protein NBRC3280_2283 [Acetobacter pasteurianus NBRC 3280]|uniref:DUF5681 domain-containing protein n=1 Tax=Acetobacter pasteurianus NBRC 3278 TaxID=1226660 RepID=A0A401X696_ACEPA|nr:DUF5681 domain-containing protein [Acetobacter pasteurianus]GCD59767.1 hypothetical protein NBRC3277_2342 [Acetobacter pasteurianus NBRC 3277]GCD63277.1 hypothetical protein NBRC3278_2370 [Acetobacter pasteurianus NBRC 3278]GCD69648.1 hypothetical protein NBRC3280_2283 [Acetobacter pasteurianus NBRC 3280]
MTRTTDDTVKSKGGTASNLRPYKKGQSGNPAGRPKGARSRLCEDFLKALHEDFQKHGRKAIESVRLEKPEVYFNGVVKLLPQQFGLDDETKGGLTVIIKKIAD